MTQPPPSRRSSRPPEARILLRIFRGWRVTLARTMNVTAETRTAGIRAMMSRHGNDRIAYWFQLILSMGIATYGLVLGSTGVVIGAMLVSPLMSPIIEIGMGLVTGSPVLVLYASVRTFASVATVVIGSAVLTLGVPYHELNSEILTRTSPTLIDLYVASFCALAAAYTTVRQSSDTISAAAGTAISIALVPPLCVIGWGIGAGHFDVARGAAMLFTANLGAILLFAVIAFFLLAYDTVDTKTLELEVASDDALLHRVGARLRGAFGSKYGPLLRLGMPLAFVASIYVPLRRALSEVAWKARVRDAVQRVINETPVAKEAVRSTVTVEMKAVSIRMFIVGNALAASKLKSELTSRVLEAAAVTPVVDVIAVPDLEAVRLASQANVEPVLARVPRIPEVRSDLDEEIRHLWPGGVAGDLAAWSLIVPGTGTAAVSVEHFGEPLGGSGRALFASALRDRLGVSVTIRDVALSTAPEDALSGKEGEWIMQVSKMTDRLLTAEVGYLCATVLNGARKPKPGDVAEVVRSRVEEQAARLPPGRATVEVGDRDTVWISLTPCPKPERDAGPTDAATD